MIDLTEIEKKLMEKESALDKLLVKARETVRECSSAIKAIHSRDLKTARAHLKEAEKGVQVLTKMKSEFPAQVGHVLQEYAEAQITLEAIERKRIPHYKELGVEEVPYILGLLDAVGELKREMYESLRRGERKEAERYFSLMEEIYDTLLPLHFSNAVLPDFRRKQDAARMQIEQARGELL
ncbi:MAG: hypothetical protein QXT45_01235 [Candidatus Bilamarchaeaceae archaeon]